MTRLAYALLFALLGVFVSDALSHRQLERELIAESMAFDRFVDAGIEICVIERDDNGTRLIDGLEDNFVVIGEPMRFGGMIDTAEDPPCFCGPSQEPVRWYCSSDQAEVIRHAVSSYQGQIVYGGEGAGKSTISAMVLALLWLESIGEDREFGMVAPTDERTEFVRDEARKLYPSSWYRYRSSEGLLTFCEGTRIQFMGSKKQSAAIGSKLQGLNWSGGVIEEMQDHERGAVNDARSRMRSAKYGRPKMLGTCTAKQSAEFQALRDKLTKSQVFMRRDMLTENSPFIPPAFLEETAKMMSADEFNRRYRAVDPPKDGLIYKCFDRKRHLRPIPVGAKKITSFVIERKMGKREDGKIRNLLGGNDPGTAKAATIFLDAFEIRGVADPVWWVRGELFTRHKGTAEHASEVLEIARRMGCNHPKRAEIIHLRSQPVGVSDKKPDEDVYRIIRLAGLDVKAAQYAEDGKATGHIAKESRFEMINMLFQPQVGPCRLYIEADEKGENEVAPLLVNSLESMERDEKGRGETEAKNANDKSDPPSALGYGLWPFEKPSVMKPQNFRKDVSNR